MQNKMVKRAKRQAKKMSWVDWLTIGLTVVFVPLLVFAIAWMNQGKPRERIQSTIVPER
jgi:hypothetical protein